MGRTLSPDDIKEGDDVYFECHIKANPKIYKKTWYHNVSACEVINYSLAGLAGPFNSLPIIKAISVQFAPLVGLY